MNLGYKYKLLPNKYQSKLLKNHMFTTNQAYNILLNLKQQEYQINKDLSKDKRTYLTNIQFDNKVKELIRNRNLTYNTKLLQQERVRFIQNYKSNLKKIANGNQVGEVQFKKYSHLSYQSFQTTKEQYSIIDSNNTKYKYIQIFKEKIKIRWTRDLPNAPTSITISFDNNKFFIVFNVVITNKQISLNIDKDNSVGIDLNNKSIDIGNKDFHIKLPMFTVKNAKKYKDKLEYLDKKQSKRKELCKKNKTKVGKNYIKTRNKIKKINKKISNERDYKIHQITNNILNILLNKDIKCIIVEDLDVKQLTSKENVNKKLGKNKSKSMKKNILNVSYSKILDILKYKCVQLGIEFRKVNPKNTSKTCSKCGNIKKTLELSERIYKCECCGNVIDRDYNATLNILNFGFSKIK